MFDALKKITVPILDEFGITAYAGITTYIVYSLSALFVILLLYRYAWKRVCYYSDAMDRYIHELWTKEDIQIPEVRRSREQKRIRMERIKEEYEDKINTARKKRDRIFKFTPFLKAIYRKKKGKNAPLYTLPN